MAKLVGAIQFNGKLSNVVGMRGEDGRNILRERIYTIKNPNTKAQQGVRTKFVLAGLLSKLTPAELIVGLSGSSNRKRRSRFTSIINKRAQLQGDNTALLAPVDLIFSEGNQYGIANSDFTMNYDGSALTVQVNAESNIFEDENLASVIVIGVFSESRIGPYIAEQQAVLTKGTQTVTLQGTGAVVNVYVIPVLRADGATSVAYDTAVANIEATNSYSVASEAAMAGTLKYGASKYIASAARG